jgi:hypothetical protein
MKRNDIVCAKSEDFWRPYGRLVKKIDDKWLMISVTGERYILPEESYELHNDYCGMCLNKIDRYPLWFIEKYVEGLDYPYYYKFLNKMGLAEKNKYGNYDYIKYYEFMPNLKTLKMRRRKHIRCFNIKDNEDTIYKV